MAAGYVWAETPVSRSAFTAALLDSACFGGSEECLEDALRDASDFLALVKRQEDVVVLVEGYHKLQAAALDRQLPAHLRAGVNSLPQPAPLVWQVSPNLLHPQQLLARELTGRTSARTARQPRSCRTSQLEPVPFAVMERCKLLEVQYVLKELHRQQPHSMDASQQPADEPAHMQPQQQAPQLPVHQQVWDAAEESEFALQEPLCRRLSVRVVLQRLPAAPLPDEELQQGSVVDSSWQQRGLQGAGDSQRVAYTCTFEYPAFTIKSSDYIVPAKPFYEGLSCWQALQKGEAFTMLWDGMPWRGFALGFRQRRPGDPFLGSPWWSISVEWEDHNTDRRTDPEDFQFGNPWEMTREAARRPQLPDAKAALAAINLAGHPVLAAPWTAVWAAAAAEAAARAKAKRKRQSHHHDEDFIYEDGPDEEAAAVDAADLWDPTDFYYDDDPEEFEVELEEHVQPRRKSSRHQQQQSSGRRRSGSRRSSPVGGAAAADGACCSRQHKAAATAAPGELTHNYGRELLARSDVCVVCSSAEGSLISGHPGRSGGNCTRRYHAGCLLLLNATGIRSVTLAKVSAQSRKRSPVKSSGASSRAPAASIDSLCDGLLGVLWQQSGQPDHQLSPAAVAAVAAAREAAARVAAGELTQICPSHGCHGCRLNGKLEFMVWCCCCWVRVYHHRQCVPYGAEHVKVDGRDFIRCPHCRAAGVPVPSSAAAAAAGPTAATPAAAGPPAAAADADATAAAAGLAALGSDVQPLAAAACGAADMQTDQQPALALMQAPTPPSQQQHSSDTLQGMSDAEDSTGAARGGSVGPAVPAQLPAVPNELVELLDSSEPGDQEDSGPEVLLLDGSSEPELEQAHQQQQQMQDLRVDSSTHRGTNTAAAAAVGDDGADGEMMALVAALDAQLAALQQAQQQAQQQQQPVAPNQQQLQQQQQGPAADNLALLSAAAAALEELQQPAEPPDLQQPAEAPELQQPAEALELQQHVQGPSMPSWLQLALEDQERVSPSYVLVPCASPDAASSSAADAGAVSALAAAAAAAGTLPPPHPAAAGDVFEGLRLSSPHSHWLIGYLPKAEAQYKPANVWGCAYIGVGLCPDDSVYGLGVVVDFLPALQQQQQQQNQEGGVQVDLPAANSAGVRARPQVFLRCSKSVAADGQLQPALQARGRGEDERRQARQWQVLVNGQPYPARCGRNGVRLQVGDVVVVQGLSFKLQLAH